MKSDRAEGNGRAEAEKCDALRLRMQQQRNVPLQALVAGSVGAPEHVEIVQFDPSMAILCDDRHAPERPFAEVQQRSRPDSFRRGSEAGAVTKNATIATTSAETTVLWIVRPAPRAAITAHRLEHAPSMLTAVQRPTAGASANRATSGPRIAPAVFAARMAPTAGPPSRATVAFFLHQSGQRQSEKDARHQQRRSRQQSEIHLVGEEPSPPQIVEARHAHEQRG